MTSLEHITAQLQGYDPQAMTVDGVGEFLARLVPPVAQTDTLAVGDALDRVLADDVVSPIDVPAHDNSAMDGYAFSAASGHAGPYRVVGTALAGRAWTGAVGVGECLRIMTGAILPPTLDTVAPQELVRVDGDQVHVPPGALRLGDNRRLAGEDIAKGLVALARGQRLGPAALGLLASLGVAQVRVMRPVRVAYFSTGDEILSLGEPAREGAVYDSNRYTVLGMLRRLGVEVLDLGVVGDDPTALAAAFRRGAEACDAVITSGGVSVGEADHTKTMMRQLGDVAFWRIAMRPGRPMAVGRLTRPDGEPGAVLFGLPGNPVAVMVTFLAFVRPALLRMMGATVQATPLLQAHSLERLRKKAGRTEYQRGVVERAADGRLTVRTTGNQGSGVLSSMVQANGLIVLHHDQGDVAVGDAVDVMMFEGAL